ncbi:hypothetical protein H9P43_009944 [Blastocladiella emersonii ATCC 22665]|nr:hypothetical protein H9P43_009944 [Blastocladiella emersonii ATCC 22665]
MNIPRATILLLSLAALLATTASAAATSEDPALAVPSYLSTLPSPPTSPLIQPGPADASTSCAALLAAVAATKSGSMMRIGGATDGSGPVYVNMSSPRYRPASDPTKDRSVLVGASAMSQPDAKLGVLLFWHATASKPEALQDTPFLTSVRDTLVVAPASILGPLRFEWYLVQSENMHDVWLADDLVACLAQSPRIDTSRIYAAGFSAGAIHTSHLALLRPHYLAAAVAWSGGLVHAPPPMQNASVSSAEPKNPEKAPDAYAYLAPGRAVVPTLATVGGPTDAVLVTQFAATTKAFHAAAHVQSLAVAAASNVTAVPPTLIRCDHTLGHKIALGAEAAAPFLLARTFKGGESPLAAGCVAIAAKDVGVDEQAVVARAKEIAAMPKPQASNRANAASGGARSVVGGVGSVLVTLVLAVGLAVVM